MFNKLSNEIYENAKQKGFYDHTINIPEKLMLIVSEISEACEALRNNKLADVKDYVICKLWGKQFETNFEKHIKDTFEDEIADAIIRLLDLAGYLKIDLDFHINNKMEYNKTRLYKHGKEF